MAAWNQPASGERERQNRRVTRFPVLYPILDADFVLQSHARNLTDRWAVLRRLVRELAGAGIEILQYRNKRDDDVLVAQDALAMREAAPLLTLILNDRAGLVLPAGWNGVHVGQEDMSPSEARALVGQRCLVGLSTNRDEEVLAAVREPVDYIAIGPVFPTATKTDTNPVIGLEGVARARAMTAKPLIAIGGISLENAPSVYDAGADSVAVISAIFRPGRNPAQSAKDFLRIFE